MATEFRAQGGKVAIWTGAEINDAPFTDPLGNMPRVKYHSDLGYVKIVSVQTFSITIPAISGVADRAQSYSLGAHGQPGQPVVIGEIVVNGIPVAFTGSVPVHASTGPYSTEDSFSRWLSLGADATSLYVHEYAVQDGNANAGVFNSRPAQSFSITAYITDILL